MIYETRLTILPSTLPEAPASVVLPVNPGILTRVEIIFPAGCCGLVHLQVFYYEHQIYPSNPDSDFSGDDSHLEFTEDLELRGAPFEFRIDGWNYDDTYQHTPIFRLTILPFDRDIRNLFNTFQLGPTGPVQIGGV